MYIMGRQGLHVIKSFVVLIRALALVMLFAVVVIITGRPAMLHYRHYHNLTLVIRAGRNEILKQS